MFIYLVSTQILKAFRRCRVEKKVRWVYGRTEVGGHGGTGLLTHYEKQREESSPKFEAIVV